MDNISPEDELAVVFASASLYGIYLISFALSLRWQLFKTGKGWRTMWRWNRTTVNIVLIIFALTTAYVSLGLYKSRTLVYATTHNTRTSAPGLQPWYSVAIVSKYQPKLRVIAQNLPCIQCTIANTTALLVDSVMVRSIPPSCHFGLRSLETAFRYIAAGLSTADREELSYFQA